MAQSSVLYSRFVSVFVRKSNTILKCSWYDCTNRLMFSSFQRLLRVRGRQHMPEPCGMYVLSCVWVRVGVGGGVWGAQKRFDFFFFGGGGC